MINSKKLAGLIGPTLIVMTITEALNASIWVGNTAAGVYLNGTLLFIAGLSILQVHNHWSRQWPVVITLVALGAMLLGLFRMVAPEVQLKAVGNKAIVGAEAMVVLVVGIFLSVKGWGKT